MLADALFSTGLNMTVTGRATQARASFLEASGLYRRLVVAIAAAAEPDPFSRIVTYCGHLTGLRRREDALSVARSTVAIYRGLAGADPRYEPGLARARVPSRHQPAASAHVTAENPR